MAMVVQHNLAAMNSNRMLSVNTSSQSKSSEKLSSGYRINRAADDAAGLKISEKMRSQVRGLDRASTNAQDGVSLIQTAEGALNEAHSILQRMNELAVQGANDTNQSIDRDAINQELTALTKELDRISETTQFNKQELLNGSFTDKKLHVGANSNQSISISIGKMDAASLGLKSITYAKGSVTKTYNKINYLGVEFEYDTSKTAASNKSLKLPTPVGVLNLEKSIL
jgi:flagellin